MLTRVVAHDKKTEGRNCQIGRHPEHLRKTRTRGRAGVEEAGCVWRCPSLLALHYTTLPLYTSVPLREITIIIITPEEDCSPDAEGNGAAGLG